MLKLSNGPCFIHNLSRWKFHGIGHFYAVCVCVCVCVCEGVWGRYVWGATPLFMITSVGYQTNEMTLISESAHINEPFFTDKKTMKLMEGHIIGIIIRKPLDYTNYNS